MNDENRAETYIIETKIVSSPMVAEGRKNAGGKNEGILRDVIENKCIKNVRFPSFHDVIEPARVIVVFPGC